MSDSFTERSQRSWFQRIGGSFGAAGVGIVLAIAALVALFMNEGRAVKTARALSEGSGIVRSVDAATPDPANEGALVHISGAATALGVPRDPDSGVEANGSTRLQRTVEMYQWKEERRTETRTKVGGGEETVTTYSYVRDWSSSEQNSGNFRQQAGHQNPAFPIGSAEFRGEGAQIGAFVLSAEQIGGLGEDRSVQVSQQQARSLAGRAGGGRPFTLAGDTVFVGRDANAPQVGDLRISYRSTRLEAASFVGRQQGNRLAPYKTSGGRDLFLTSSGLSSAAEMFESAQRSNTLLTWLIRAGGLLMLFIAFRMIFGFLAVFADVIPLFGRLVRGATGLVSFAMALMLGSVAISIGWIAYRPLVGGAILLAGVAIGFFLLRRGRTSMAAQPA